MGDSVTSPNRRAPGPGLDRSQGLPRPARQAGARPAGRSVMIRMVINKRTGEFLGSIFFRSVNAPNHGTCIHG